ncbi:MULTISPECIES: DUF2891 domain-containing protein [unclassified Streptomyces]|uniref:DUF2891 domain-containing protein n=1 Tax=unclassified Streptomyces TaxID=2593676 RepID=UPI00278C8844|nr:MULTISPECIES: DUF2891 domain-containing protein [unclassified Streptomyces]
MPTPEETATLAAANVTREYPNFTAHLTTSPDDRPRPSDLHPAFYGAYDWHSSVHMHWLLVRTGPEAHADVLDRHLTRANLTTEADYLLAHPGFERPYGWAWLIALAAQCHGTRWYDAFAPAVAAVDRLLTDWLPKATYPVRHGIHANSAFALGLVLDTGERAGLPPRTLDAVRERLSDWFADDHDAPAHWEPSGQDFLSPALTEADAMRRVFEHSDPGNLDAFAAWLNRFLPALAADAPCALLDVPVVSDHSDPHIGHLLGLALSRAAALHAIAGALPEGRVRDRLTKAAHAHLDAGLPAVESGDFTTDHWLATFAELAREQRDQREQYERK